MWKTVKSNLNVFYRGFQWYPKKAVTLHFTLSRPTLFKPICSLKYKSSENTPYIIVDIYNIKFAKTSV